MGNYIKLKNAYVSLRVVYNIVCASDILNEKEKLFNDQAKLYNMYPSISRYSPVRLKSNITQV